MDTDTEMFNENPGASFDIIKKLFDDEKGLPFITDLSIKEIHNISIILFLSDYLELPEFKTFIKNVMKLKVSKDRKGRAEFIDTFKEIKRVEDTKKSLEQKLI